MPNSAKKIICLQFKEKKISGKYYKEYKLHIKLSFSVTMKMLDSLITHTGKIQARLHK